ncbi:MAG: dihydrodipicolinate synthase family protein [Thermomicrobiales bacterium]|nr:dihydrodipicolinate synthase family protein [Thermomicrobiales bacterium]
MSQPDSAPPARLAGCIPILCTPFTENGALDLASLERQIEWLLEAGATGLACNAIASEGYKLTEAERDAVVAATVAAAAGRVPVVVAADGPGFEPAVDRACRAARAGAAALMALPPYFVKPDTAALLEYYRRIGAESGLPLIVQDAPQLTGVAMGPELWARMAEAIPEFVSVKVEGTPQGATISAVRQLCGDRLTVFCGWGGLSVLDALERGAVGSMPAPNLTREFVAIQQRWDAGDRRAAERVFAAALPFVLWTMQSVDFSVAAAKEEFRRRGIFTTNLQRGPALALDAVSRGQLDRFLDARLAAA